MWKTGKYDQSQEKRQLMETQMLELANEDFKAVSIYYDQGCKKNTVVINEDGNRGLCCCLWAGCTGRRGDTSAELGLRGEEGKEEQKGKGKKRGGAWRRERKVEERKVQNSKRKGSKGCRTVSWEGTAGTCLLTPWIESQPLLGASVLILSPQEHCSPCDPPTSASSNTAASRQSHSNTHPRGRERNRETSVGPSMK